MQLQLAASRRRHSPLPNAPVPTDQDWVDETILLHFGEAVDRREDDPRLQATAEGTVEEVIHHHQHNR